MMDAFQMIDIKGRGWITALELREALEDFGVFTHINDVQLFVRRYDRDSDGRILYSDFCQAFCPKDSLCSALVNQRDA